MLSKEMKPDLPTCPFLGPVFEREPIELPRDYKTDPLKYLPPKVVLSAEEMELAARYEKGDFSGGYITSQIALFRRGPSAKQHQRRREEFRRLKAEVDRRHLVLPNAFIELIESDEYVARLRENGISITLPDELVSLPSDPRFTMFLIFGEAQGCGFWHLLLAPDGGHSVTFSDHHFGLRNMYPEGQEPDPASFKVYHCADDFAQWIVSFFSECIRADHHYEKTLRNCPGM